MRFKRLGTLAVAAAMLTAPTVGMASANAGPGRPLTVVDATGHGAGDGYLFYWLPFTFYLAAAAGMFYFLLEDDEEDQPVSP